MYRKKEKNTCFRILNQETTTTTEKKKKKKKKNYSLVGVGA